MSTLEYQTPHQHRGPQLMNRERTRKSGVNAVSESDNSRFNIPADFDVYSRKQDFKHRELDFQDREEITSFIERGGRICDRPRSLVIDIVHTIFFLIILIAI